MLLKKIDLLRCAFMLVFVVPSMLVSSPANARQVRQVEWSTSASNLESRLDQDFAFSCPSGGSVGTIWGTDLYTTDSSICTAAAHAGLINVRDGGQVTIRIRPGADFYNPSKRNNISSSSYGSYRASFVFLDGNGQPLSSDKQVMVIAWSSSASSIETRLDQEFVFDCPRNGVISNVWGTNLYTSDSSICSAAVHQGIISNARGGRVTILIRPGASSYRGTLRNGVKSANYGEYRSSFSFVTKRGTLQPTSSEEVTGVKPSSDRVGNCQDDDRAFVIAETRNFFVSICGKNKPSYYIGTAKDTGSSIRLSVSSSSAKKYTIKNRGVAYVLTPQSLTITQNGKVLQQDPIISSQWQ
jgi:LCCL domain